MSIEYIAGNLLTQLTLPPDDANRLSSEDTVFQVENLYAKRHSMPFRFTSNGSGGAEWVEADAGAGKWGASEINRIALLNHNLVGTGAFSLKIQAADVTPVPDPGFLYEVDLSAKWNKQNIWTAVAPPASYQYWRVIVEDPDNPYNISWGELVYEKVGAFTRNYDWGYRHALKWWIADHVSPWGARWRSKHAKQKAFGIRFQHVTDAHFISEVEAFFEALDGALPFVVIMDNTKADCWYVFCLNNLEAERRFLNMNNFSLELEEQSRGKVML